MNTEPEGPSLQPLAAARGAWKGWSFSKEREQGWAVGPGAGSEPGLARFAEQAMGRGEVAWLTGL